MQVAAPNSTTESNTYPFRLVVSAEAVAIVALICISLLFRLASLGRVPLAEPESRQALSAWRAASPQAPGDETIADSPVTFWLQRISFGMLGANETSARLFTALAGVALTLSPLLFRELLGRARAFLFAVLLTLSPVVLTASRFGSGSVWAALFAVLGLWALWRYWEAETRRNSYAVVAMVAFGALLFLSEPGGPVLGLILLAAGAVSLSVTALTAPNERDLPGNDFLVSVRERFWGWPWGTGLAFVGLVIVAFGTGFMLYPGGLSMIGALLEGFFSGFTKSPEGAPIFFPLAVSLFYESWLWLLAAITVILLYWRGAGNFVERFLLGWVAFGLIAALVYMGAGATHALWLTVPLAGLASYAVADAFTEYKSPFYLFGTSYGDERRWKWLLAFAMFALLLVAALQFQVVSRFFLSVPGGSLTEYLDRLSVPLPKPSPAGGLLWLVIVLMLGVGGAYLAAGIWGTTVTWQSAVLGLSAFAAVALAASGWNVAVANADDPVELWHVKPTALSIGILRQTLFDLSFRETQGAPMVPIAVVGDGDSVVAWQVRDFPNARFVDTIRAAQAEEIILIVQADVPPITAQDVAGASLLPDLGGSYVGQRFILNHTWSSDWLQGFDFLPWWATRDTRFDPQPSDVVMLWVRQDIYNSEPFLPAVPGPK